MKTIEEVGYELMLAYMVKNIGWQPEQCCLKAKEGIACVRKHFPSIVSGDPVVTADAPPKVAETQRDFTPYPPQLDQVRRVGRPNKKT